MTQGKFHINGEGVPAKCTATVRACPFGGAESHFSSMGEAQEAADKNNKAQYGSLASDAVQEHPLNESRDPKELESYLEATQAQQGKGGSTTMDKVILGALEDSNWSVTEAADGLHGKAYLRTSLITFSYSFELRKVETNEEDVWYFNLRQNDSGFFATANQMAEFVLLTEPAGSYRREGQVYENAKVVKTEKAMVRRVLEALQIGSTTPSA